jgi:hypothetical protein
MTGSAISLKRIRKSNVRGRPILAPGARIHGA